MHTYESTFHLHHPILPVHMPVDLNFTRHSLEAVIAPSPSPPEKTKKKKKAQKQKKKNNDTSQARPQQKRRKVDTEKMQVNALLNIASRREYTLGDEADCS